MFLGHVHSCHFWSCAPKSPLHVHGLFYGWQKACKWVKSFACCQILNSFEIPKLLYGNIIDANGRAPQNWWCGQISEWNLTLMRRDSWLKNVPYCSLVILTFCQPWYHIRVTQGEYPWHHETLLQVLQLHQSGRIFKSFLSPCNFLFVFKHG